MSLIDGYLHWGAGGVLVSVTAVGFWMTHHKLLGVGASLHRVADSARTSEDDALRVAAVSDQEALIAALRAATAAEFGEASLEQEPSAESEPTSAQVDAPWHAHLAYLASIAIGGTFAELLRTSAWTVDWAPSPGFEQWFGSGVGGLGVLWFGGMLVGAGTRMSGGCTYGHGLTGVSALHKSSWAATGTFFGVAVGTSLLFSRVLG